MSERQSAGGRRIMRRALVRNRGRLAAGITGTSLHQAAEALVPVAIGTIIDRAVATGDGTALALSLAGLAALFTVLTLSWRYGARSLVAAVQQESHLLRVEASARAIDPRRADTGLRSGELLSVTTSDADRTARMLHFIPAAFATVVGLAVAAVSLLRIDTALGAGVLVAVPVLVAAVQLAGPLLTRRATAQQAAVARTAGLATDLVRGLPALRGIGAEENAARRYRESSETALRSALRAALPSGLYLGATTMGGGLLLAGVAGFAGTAAIQGRISVGELVTIVGLAQFLTEPVRELGMYAMGFAVSRASADRLAGVVDAPFRLGAAEVGAEPAEAPADPEARVELKGVRHATLDGLDLVLGPGELLGVVCLEPADAQALFALLSGRVPAAEREGRAAIRPGLLAEPHDVDLFEGTLRSNVLAGVGGGDGDIGPALRASAADEVVRTVPGGLDAPVTDRGTTLSGGQRQRVGLARALAADPPVLVLHDPTTAVDAVTEENIAEGLRALRHGPGSDRSTAVLTSSPALLARADRVLVVADGRVAAEGTHAELSASDAGYARAVLR
ncbi:ABC transporter ATP-binding protein [Nocardiopsis potens]|uniref:ABC transporter ATP-binding protein n=1 Tax=Nocardiopsis potens TaxID=1246458 RepID=UPI000347890B|nr:ABC transporter ATP-binding protein [Nocardiopsis potens]